MTGICNELITKCRNCARRPHFRYLETNPAIGIFRRPRSLVFIAGLCDFGLWKSAFDRRDYAAHLVYCLDVAIRGRLHVERQAFKEITPAQRIRLSGHPSLVGDYLLGA